LKKTLLEQSIKRLNQLQTSQNMSENNSSGHVDGSLEASDEKRSSIRGSVDSLHSGGSGSGEKFYQYSDDTFKNNSSASTKMQQALDEFTDFFEGPLTEDEQDLIK
jgi:uncharacterized protein involved in type VI secretion and phage assembly